MKLMKTLFVVPALAFAVTATSAEAWVTRDTPKGPPASYEGQWFVTSDGCSYSRTQAPGYPPKWILIQNPHHIGMPDTGDHCANVLQSG